MVDRPENDKHEQTRKEVRADREKGLAVIKRGVLAFQKMAGELAEEGKRQFTLAATKSKMQDAKRDLGVRVYTLIRGAEAANPALDDEVKNSVARIRGLEEECAKLEGKAAAPRQAIPAPGSPAGDATNAREKAEEAPRPKTTRRGKAGIKRAKKD